MPKAKNEVLERKLAIAGKVVSQLRQILGRNLRAAGIGGSVARGTAQKYSDIDLLLIVRKQPTSLGSFGIHEAHSGSRSMFVDDTYCSLGFETWNSAVSQLTNPSTDLPELLGGFTKIRPVYDPESLLPRLEAKARNIPPEVFRRSAELALLHSYEDFCRVKNAYLAGDEMVLRDNALYVTHSAALVVAALNRAHFRSDREIFKAHGNFAHLPRSFGRVQKIRYGNLSPRELCETVIRLYLDLIAFADRRGIPFPVTREKLLELAV